MKRGTRGLGRGGRLPKYRRLVAARRAPRQFVPRTQGPFAVTESKYFDREIVAVAVPETTTWGAVNDLSKGIICTPQEGSDINNRIGRKVSLYKIAIRGVIQRTVTAAAGNMVPTSCFRMILYQDKQANATVTTAAELMTVTTSATLPMAFSKFQNPANFGRFRVLKDFCIDSKTGFAATDGANTSSQANGDILFKITHKFKTPVKIRFNATNGGGIGDIVDNAFYFAVQASDGTGVNTLTACTRAYYKDN